MKSHLSNNNFLYICCTPCRGQEKIAQLENEVEAIIANKEEIKARYDAGVVSGSIVPVTVEVEVKWYEGDSRGEPSGVQGDAHPRCRAC